MNIVTQCFRPKQIILFPHGKGLVSSFLSLGIYSAKKICILLINVRQQAGCEMTTCIHPRLPSTPKAYTQDLAGNNIGRESGMSSLKTHTIIDAVFDGHRLWEERKSRLSATSSHQDQWIRKLKRI